MLILVFFRKNFVKEHGNKNNHAHNNKNAEHTFAHIGKIFYKII